jgi:hypothetical protein
MQEPQGLLPSQRSFIEVHYRNIGVSKTCFPAGGAVRDLPTGMHVAGGLSGPSRVFSGPRAGRNRHSGRGGCH